ncbi:glycosyltransferase family 4 protein [Microvirga calopogonii]|uniref:glycosyltransferase family 4 protein n=1 Tax=Microvirga calopogonii TaxID=2078013 RepID=UPI000E0CCFEB|nr:glycosyltransferase family 4 protein [Microvirga calopogonii]
MKICVLGLRGIPSVVGGIETHCEQLYPRLQGRRSSDSFTIIGRRSYCGDQSSQFNGVEVVALPHMKSKHLEAISNSIIALLYARFQLHADIVHIHAIGPALVAPIAKALGLTVVVTHHGTDYNRDRWHALAKGVLRIGEFCALHFADHVIVVSPSLTKNLKKRHQSRSSHITFIPNGANHVLDVTAWQAASSALLDRFNLKPGRYVITVGRLVPEKGFDCLIRSFRRSNCGMKLVIVGDAGMDQSFVDTLHREADENVVFTGYLSQPDVVVLLRHASLFVLASRHEGLPIAALEAAMSGCPVLLSDIEANLDLGFPSTSYFRVGDVEDLERKLRAPHHTFSVDRPAVLNDYDWNRISEATSQVYTRLMSST